MTTPADLRRQLLSPDEAARLDAPGSTNAAVLIPLYLERGELVAVFTERRADLRRHAGEISFPGGRQDRPDEDLRETALRETQEEIGLAPENVELVGALPPTGTFVTGYKIHPFVGLIEPGHAWTLQESEVAAVLELPLAELRAGYESKRLLGKGVPIKTPTYTVRSRGAPGYTTGRGNDPSGRVIRDMEGKLAPTEETHFVWGATGRIVESLLERLAPLA